MSVPATVELARPIFRQKRSQQHRARVFRSKPISFGRGAGPAVCAAQQSFFSESS